ADVKCRSTSYDVVILDIMLPKVDGLTLLKRWRANGIKTHVIMLTARGTTQDKVAGLDTGADDYLTKPFELDELLARLRALDRRGRVHPLPAEQDRQAVRAGPHHDALGRRLHAPRRGRPADPARRKGAREGHG